MSRLRISLFGRLKLESDGKSITDSLDGRKVEELLSYLILYRHRSHPRESLADVLWGDSSGIQARKYLRQALWQLQAALKPEEGPEDGGALLVDPEWVGINTHADLWTDVGEFEDAFAAVQGVPGGELEPGSAQTLVKAVELHQGGLLQGWYHDWCIFERERLQNMYLAMLNKLMTYNEAQREYEAGLLYGHRILRLDRAHERTHWRMMRLHYLAGDRTAALRQYERCIAGLEEELGVKPARWTVALYDQIRADELSEATPRLPERQQPAAAEQPPSVDATAHVQRLQTILFEFRDELQRYIQASRLTSRE